MKNLKFSVLLRGVAYTSLLALAFFSMGTKVRADSLYRQLEINMTGADVSSLQTFLAQDRSIYPQGLVTGYFGPLTKTAVMNFQTRNNIAAVGRVGPITLAAINAQMNDGKTGYDRNAPILGPINTSTNASSATVSWNTNENAAAIIYYSNMPLNIVEANANTAVNISGSTLVLHTDLRMNHSGTITGLQSNTPYYFVAYVRDGSGNESMSVPMIFRTSN